MPSWTVVHIPTRSLANVIAKSLDRVLTICRKRGWRVRDLMIRVK